MKKLLFIVTEIAPLDRGGIGTFSRNIIREFFGKFSIAFLYCGNAPHEALEREYPEIRFHFLPRESKPLFEKTAAQISEVIAGTLDIIFQKEIFDYIEFMDWGGWAHQTIMLKRSGASNIPASTVIAVRIHSTEHALRKYEHRLLSLGDGETSDFELGSILLADSVVCHVAPIAALITNEIKSLFGKDISGKIIITSMPVYIRGNEKNSSITASHSTNIVFSSKTQQIKRPDLFVTGASLFLERNKAYNGKIIFAAHMNEDVYTRSVLSLIPKEKKDFFVYDKNIAGKERDAIISGGITVFPAEYESFCFAAYEASMTGSIVVLNETNPAFADGTPWEDGVNCIKFDGTAEGLCAALERAASLGAPLQSVRRNLPEPQIVIPFLPPKSQASPPSVDILICAHDLKGLGNTMQSIQLNGFGEETAIHVFLTHEAIRAMEAVPGLRDKVGGRFRILPQGAAPIAALRTCAAESNADYILFLPAGDELSPNILDAFIKSSKNNDIDVFSSWTCNVHQGGHINRFYGAMPLNGWRANLVASSLAFYKTTLIRDYFKKAGGRVFNFYAMHLHLSMTGANYVISNRHESINNNSYHEYSIHDSPPMEKSAFFRALLLDFLPIPPPTLAILMARPELTQTSGSSGKTLPTFDTYIYRKYIRRIKFIDNILRRLKIVT